MLYPVFGSAFAATSGTIRPGPLGAPTCQMGIGWKMVEKPPPVPSPVGFPGSLFQTVSACAVLLVPPQPMTCVHEAGKSTLAGLVPPSEESLSPEAAKTIMPLPVAAVATCSIFWAAVSPQFASSDPHEIEQTSQPSAAAAWTPGAISLAQ